MFCLFYKAFYTRLRNAKNIIWNVRTERWTLGIFQLSLQSVESAGLWDGASGQVSLPLPRSHPRTGATSPVSHAPSRRATALSGRSSEGRVSESSRICCFTGSRRSARGSSL